MKGSEPEVDRKSHGQGYRNFILIYRFNVSTIIKSTTNMSTWDRSLIWYRGYTLGRDIRTLTDIIQTETIVNWFIWCWGLQEFLKLVVSFDHKLTLFQIKILNVSPDIFHSCLFVIIRWRYSVIRQTMTVILICRLTVIYFWTVDLTLLSYYRNMYSLVRSPSPKNQVRSDALSFIACLHWAETNRVIDQFYILFYREFIDY